LIVRLLLSLYPVPLITTMPKTTRKNVYSKIKKTNPSYDPPFQELKKEPLLFNVDVQVVRINYQSLSKTRIAISKPRKVAPLANGDRIKVGPRPRVKAPMPSDFQTVLTQSSVDLYFCPVSGVNPSVYKHNPIPIDYITVLGTPSKRSIFNGVLPGSTKVKG